MTQRLPPLENLRFFEVAARHLNFTRAAEELHVTHGAVSQRIAALEADLGVGLFSREGRNMVLTEAGRAFHESVRVSLGEIARAVDVVRSGIGIRPLRITTLPAFATHWLIPRLSKFHALHPEVEIALVANFTLADLDRDRVDLAIRFGLGSWPDVQAEKLFDEYLTPVCSPNFNQGVLPQRSEDLLHTSLLQDERQPWRLWFSAVGLGNAQARGPIYSNSNLLLQAAVSGHGVALAKLGFAQIDLNGGRLVRLFPKAIKTRFSYYLLYGSGVVRNPNLAKFRTWLLEESASESAG
jgi:LysR family glycine cleavage system transcriptional activator